MPKPVPKRHLEISQQNNEKHIEALSLIWLGRILAKTNPSQINKARKNIVEGIKICDDMRIRPFYSMGYLSLGEFYAGADQREKALECLKKAEGMFQKMGMDFWLAKTHEVLEKL